MTGKNSVNGNGQEETMDDFKAEKAVLGSILIDGKLIHSIVEIIGTNSNVFHDKKNRKVYAAMLELSRNKTPIDLLTVKSILEQKHELEKIGGMEYLTMLVEDVDISEDAKKYAYELKGK